MKRVLVLIASIVLLAGCEHTDTSTQKEQRAQEEMSLRAVESVGMPSITKLSEKRMMKTIIELRDKEVPTFTYLVGMNNELKLLCNSMGFGLPYSTQYTSPEKIGYQGSYGVVTMPQADPNGLYSPASADGTWVQCLNPETKLATVVFVEPRIIVSPFPLK